MVITEETKPITEEEKMGKNLKPSMVEHFEEIKMKTNGVIQESHKTGLYYRNSNLDNLTEKYLNEGYKDNSWGTYLHWNVNGRVVIEGEKGVKCFHPTNRPYTDDNGETKFRVGRKYFSLFNKDQTLPREVVR